MLQQLAKDGLVTRSPKRGTRSAESLMLRINQLAPVTEFGGDSSIRTELKTLEYRTLGAPPHGARPAANSRPTGRCS